MKHLKIYEEYSDDDSDAMRKLYVALEILGISDTEGKVYMVDDSAEYQSGAKSLTYNDVDVLIYYDDDTEEEFTTDWPLHDKEWDNLKKLFKK